MRFTIRYAPEGVGYRVSVPNYQGGEVVTADEFDALREIIAQRDAETILLSEHEAQLEAETQRLQSAADAAHAALLSSQYVGGLSERDAWRKAFSELCAVATQHKGQIA